MWHICFHVYDEHLNLEMWHICFHVYDEHLKVILYSYLILKKMNERITDS